jgi:hypothetical protein
MIAPIGCNFNPLHKSDPTDKDFTKCKGDSLVDRNADKQFTMSLPIVTKGKNFGKPSAKQVTFNSVRCAPHAPGDVWAQCSRPWRVSRQPRIPALPSLQDGEL